MENPRILMLVIANDDGGLYSKLQEFWLRYMNSEPAIDCYFIKGRESQTEPFVLEENSLYIKTREGYAENDALWVKTLKAFQYFEPVLDKYEFMFRTNLSSHVRFDKYLEFCKGLPRTNLCCAPIGDHGVLFPSGTGYTLSIDLVKRFIKDPPAHRIIDDVTVGWGLHAWGIPIQPAPRVDFVNFCSLDEFYERLPNVGDAFHFRLRTIDEGRLERETVMHTTLCDIFYPPPKTTIVTMFFDLTGQPDASLAGRPREFYMKNSYTLKIPAPMVIFCDSVTRRELEAIRGNMPTVYVEKNITEYDFFKEYLPIIQRNRSTVPTYGKENRNTPSYYLITMFKIIALRAAAERDDFGSSHYAWIDFGCRHVLRGPMLKPALQMLAKPNPKVSVIYIHYRGKEQLADMVGFVNRGPCGIAAGVFTVEGAFMERFYLAMMSIFCEMLEKGCGHSEETVLTYCYDRHPELFTLRYGNYYSCLSNYHGPTDDYHSIRRFFIEEALKAGRRDLASDAAKMLLVSSTAGKLNLHAHDIEFLKAL